MIRASRDSPPMSHRRRPTNNATWYRSNRVAELTLQIVWHRFSSARARGVVQRVCQWDCSTLSRRKPGVFLPEEL
jgi:hypothetical protein